MKWTVLRRRYGSGGDRGVSEAISGMFRPAVFAWPFWAALAATFARQAFDFFGEGGRFGLGLVTLSALVLAAAWTVLPWEAGASARRKLAVPIFLLAWPFDAP